jgi:tripartite-type tricarboxylate transporter receptor subunit TctC
MSRPYAIGHRAALILGCGALALCLARTAATAESIAPRPIRILMPYAAGSGWDTTVRILAEAVGQRTKDTFVVDNRPGANTIIGANACKSGDTDGTTLCVLSTSSMMLNPLLYKNLSYRPREDFEPVSLVAFVDHIIIMRKSVPANTFKEMVEYSKAHPDALNFGTNGYGSDLHLEMEWIKNKTGAKLQHIPYKGIAPAMLAFEAGDIQMLSLTPSTGSLVDRVNSGNVKGLVVDSDERLPIVPNVPTFVEAGMPPYKLRGWLGLFAPKGTPKDVVAKLSKAFGDVVKDPEFQKRHLLPFGFWPVGSAPDVLSERMVATQAEATELFSLSGVQTQ